MNSKVKLRRTGVYQEGVSGMEYLYICDCKEKQRGEKGGICGRCGGAIPTDEEVKKYGLKTGKIN